MQNFEANSYIARHSPFKHQLPLKNNLKKFLSSWDVEGKRLNICKSKGLQRPTQTGSSQDPQRTSNWRTLHIVHLQMRTCLFPLYLYCKMGYPHQCYLNVKVPLHHEEPQMQETTSSQEWAASSLCINGARDPRSYKIRNNFTLASNAWDRVLPNRLRGQLEVAT